jgi:hypothetical protein
VEQAELGIQEEVSTHRRISYAMPGDFVIVAGHVDRPWTVTFLSGDTAAPVSYRPVHSGCRTTEYEVILTYFPNVV